MSDHVLVRVKSLSNCNLGLRVEITWPRFNRVLEVFKVANAEFLTGIQVNFKVEPGRGIRVSASSNVNA